MLADANPATRSLATSSFGAWGSAVGGAAGFGRGWQAFLWRNAFARVHTEQGFDKLLARGPSGQPGAGGFHGQQLLQQWSNQQTAFLCADHSGGTPGRDPQSGACYRPVPLVQSMLRPLVPLHQHDLANLLFDYTPQQFSWDAAMGLQLALLLKSKPCSDLSHRCPWAFAVATMQREVIAPTANHILVDFVVRPTSNDGAAASENWATTLAPPPEADAGPWRASNVTVLSVRADDGTSIVDWHPEPLKGVVPQTLSASIAAPGFGHRSQPLNTAVTQEKQPDHVAEEETLPWQEAQLGSISGLFARSFMGGSLPEPSPHFLLLQFGVDASAWRFTGGVKPSTNDVVAVWHPFGPSSDVVTPALEAWPTSAPVNVAAFSRTVANRTVTVQQCSAVRNVTRSSASTVVVPEAAFACDGSTDVAFVGVWA